jgi:hypothetical protein
MDSLVEKLSQGTHPVEVDLRPEKTATALKRCIDNGYVHVKFTETRGGTVLGIKLNQTDLSRADFTESSGSIRLSGRLSLNYVEVECIADIDLQTLTGRGWLDPVQVN